MKSGDIKTVSTSRLFTAPVRKTGSVKSQASSFDITNVNLVQIVWGLGFTASGGGGALLDGIALAEDMITRGFTSLTAKAASAAPANEMVVMPGGMGAPSAIAGGILNFVPACQAALQKLVDDGGLANEVTGFTPVEAGPVNALLAVYLAYLMPEYSLYNCDGAGRAVPSLTNLLYDYETLVYFSPAAAANIDGSESEICPSWCDAAAAENGLRDIIADFGGAIGLAAWPQTGAELGAADINVTTFSDAATMGQVLQSASSSADDLAAALRTIAPASYKPLIWSTVLEDVVVDPDGETQGYDKGYLVFSDSADPDSEYRLYYLNENMFISRHDSTGAFQNYVATAPSIIAGFYSDPNPPSFMGVQPNALIPYNTGDTAVIQTLINKPMVVAVLPPSASTLYRGDLKDSFVSVLNDYFGGDGFTFDLSDISPQTPV